MFSLRKMSAVFKKQLMDNIGARSIIFQSLFYPLFILLFTMSDSDADSVEKIAVVSMLTAMFIGSAPMQTINNIIREDKFSGALRALTLASVKPLEYMTGIGLFLWIISSITALIIGIIGGFTGIKLLYFFTASTLGGLLTIILGGILSLRQGNQTNAVMLINLLSIINGIIPLLDMMYPDITAVTQFWYTQQVKKIIALLYFDALDGMPFSFAVIAANLAIFIVVFILAYRKSRIFSQQ